MCVEDWDLILSLACGLPDHVCPQELSYYISAMLRLFTTYGNYESRAKSRTRYLQDTLGEEEIRKHFLAFMEQAKKEAAWPISNTEEFSKKGDGVISGKRIIKQKQDGLFAVSYHPIGGCLNPEKPSKLYKIIKDMPQTEIRISPDGTLYIINLTAKEVPIVLEATEDGANTLFESSVSCIGSSICQHGLQTPKDYWRPVLNEYVRKISQIFFFRKIHISGCPSSCGSHQIASLGFVGHSKKIDNVMQSAFKVYK